MLTDYSEFMRSGMEPGDDFTGMTEVESMFVTSKYDSPVTLWGHKQGDKTTMLSVSYIDPFFLYNDHYRAFANITDRYPKATFPYQPQFRSYP